MKRLFTILAMCLLALCAQAQMLVSTQFNTAQLPLQLTNLNGLFNAQFGLDSAGKTVIASGASLTNLIVRVTLTVPSGGTFQIVNDQYTSGLILRNGDGTGDFEISSATLTVDGTLTAGGLAGPGSGITSIAAGNISSGTLAAGRLPALTGDVTTSAGSAATTIANSAVTYPKMQNISATQRVLGRNTAGAGVAEEVTFSQFLDWVGSAAQGDILYRGASTWTRLAAGTSGQFLKTLGAAANPLWAAPNVSSLGDVTLTSLAAGNVLAYSGTAWTNGAPSGGNGGISIDFESTQFVTNTTGVKLTLKGAAQETNVINSGIVTLTDAATVATDASLGTTFKVTLAGNRTLGNPTNAKDGERLTWEVIQDGTGGRTLAMDTKFAFGTDITGITLTTTASKRDFITAFYDGTADKFYITGFVRGY